MKKSELMRLRQQNTARVLQPPPAKKPDSSDELARLFDDGTELPKDVASLPPSDAQPVRSSLSPGGSLPETTPPARQNDSLPESDSLPRGDSQPANLLASLPATPGFLRLPNAITDNLLRLLDTDAQAIYIQLYRLSHGNGKPTCWISLPRLAERTNVKMTSLKAAIKRLEERGLITKMQMSLGYGKAQGVEYRVSAPDSQPSRDRQSGRGSLSESGYIKEHTLKDTHTQAQGVRVCSRFSLSECRAYAESLRADGITNPGGYATKIHRSGEADDLVAAFLAPSEPPIVVDASRCADCGGTGFRAHESGKGVVKCKHERLHAIKN